MTDFDFESFLRKYEDLFQPEWSDVKRKKFMTHFDSYGDKTYRISFFCVEGSPAKFYGHIENGVEAITNKKWYRVTSNDGIFYVNFDVDNDNNFITTIRKRLRHGIFRQAR